jgi:cob(I)alamin adenosyltransferase
MVVLNRIYTRTGDDGTSGLADGSRRGKADLRFAAMGDIDETNAAIGLALVGVAEGDLAAILRRAQNDLFDLGGREALRIVDSQVTRLESEIDRLNEGLEALRSFILPGGTKLAAGLHVARTVCRRAERTMVALEQAGESVNPPALRYVNRLSDLLFVAARFANVDQGGDVLWVPAANR